jgi:hypothetical protein
VYIRKSSGVQEEQAQVQNVQTMLREMQVVIPDGQWFVDTGSRMKAEKRPDFQRLMGLIKADQVRTVYIESQNRWGTKNSKELFALLYVLCAHGTALYDLRAKLDLTKSDLPTELLAMMNSFKSEQELKDIAYQSLRSRVNNFLATGSWPTGTHPYGYGKRCFAADGRLLWEWQPVNRSTGQIFYPDSSGGLTAGPDNVKLPRKAKDQVIKLVPSNHPDTVRAVGLVFDLYVRVGLSRRQISARLNKEGLTFNGGPFTHQDVTNILINPAYAGDTYFGKVQTGEIHTFDAKGVVVEAVARPDGRRREFSQCLVKKGTHEPLVDRQTWELARQKLAAEQERTSYSPRNPAYYLKQLFVCGHCGKNLTGRTEIDKKTRERTVMYVCSTFLAGRCNGHPTACGYHRITHEDAERLLLDKVRELGLEYDEEASAGARANLSGQIDRLGDEMDDADYQHVAWIKDGVRAFLGYLNDTYRLPPESLRRLEVAAGAFYTWGFLTRDQVAGLPATPDAPVPAPMKGRPRAWTPECRAALAEFKKALRAAEDAAAAEARQALARLRDEHTACTRNWVKATDAMQAVLKQDIERIEAETRAWEPRTVPLSDQLRALDAAQKERQAEREQLLAEWPTLEGREKGEALRRLFKTVTLSWEQAWHPRVSKPPRTRPPKTNRPGRYGYTLKRDKIEWAFATSDLTNSS